MKANTIYVLNHDPLIVAGCFATLEQVRVMRRPFTFLYHNAGWLRPRNLLRYIRANQEFGLQRRLIVITNEPSEARWLQLVGVEAYALSHNIHVRDQFFVPTAESAKKYDAVYAAQLSAFKRLSLARDIANLIVVTYEHGKQEWDLHSYDPALRHAAFNKTFVPPEAVRDVYRASRVALALSSKEGAMFASMEYLMCGLPVVTTRNRGGRNRYLTPLNSRFVAACPKAVARAVADFAAAPPDPLSVRAEVLGLVQRDRLAYLRILSHRCGASIHTSEYELDRLWGGESGIEKHAMSVTDFLASIA